MKKTQRLLFTVAYALIIVFIIIISTVPPVSRDAQTHHLALPKIWLSEGVLSVVPEMEFSYYPQLIDLLYILPVAMNYDIAAKYIHFSFALGTALLIFLFIRRFIGGFWGLMGGAMFLTLPIILKLSVTVYVDLGLLFFFTASLFAVLIWLENPDKLRWLMIAGISSGLALSTKYNAILAVVILTLLLGYFYFKIHKNKENSQIKFFKHISLFSIIAILIFSPWAIRNVKLTGNPIYPLHDSFFSQLTDNSHAKQETLNTQQEEKLKPLTLRRVMYQESPLYTLALPLRVFFEGEDNKPQYFDGKLNPMLLLFALLLFIKTKNSDDWRYQFLTGFVVITLLYTMFVTDMRIRYIITIVTPMIVLSVFGLHRFSQWLKRLSTPLAVKSVTTMLLTTYFAFNLVYAKNLYHEIDPLPYLTGEVSREAYISNKLPYYSLNQLANQVVPENGKLLGIYTGFRRYYLDIPHTLESELLIKLAQKTANASELASALSQKRISHMLIRMDLLNNRLLQENSDVRARIGQFFEHHMKPLAAKDQFALYEINKLLP
ncbi:ArnT family glycosyltransferase [Marinicella meishanensis]|uniref:ArnT family glycosyltransferase n=1 Tax=Marinicella meishanensis TaxID=2873263 RepID=UPI001CBC869A|nr:glycosyltransferase family 39 protein [Marinicella sp. NBU2979]